MFPTKIKTGNSIIFMPPFFSILTKFFIINRDVEI